MTATTLQRLLEYPHAAVFDKDPVAALVMRVRHPSGCRWIIRAGTMTVTAGVDEFTYDLKVLTVAGLVSALRNDGLEVIKTSSAFGSHSALVLVEGAGDQGESNGDHIYGFRSLLWALFTAYTQEVDEAAEQVRQALLQMVIGTASGEWLDLWATLYSVQRLPGEADEALRVRIPREAFRIRVNARAIEQAIKDATGYDVHIGEPWEDIFILDESVLSGPHKLQDGERIGYHLIQPSARGYIDWPAVLAVIDRNRAAGVGVLGPKLRFVSHVVTGLSPTVHAGGQRLHKGGQTYEDRVFLDFMQIEDVPILNHPAQRRQERLHAAHLQVPQTYVVHSRQWRDYRVYQGAVAYESQQWSFTGGRTWASQPVETWRSLTAVVGSRHTRQS